MKKFGIFVFLGLCALGSVLAQDADGGQTVEGKWLIEANTGFGDAAGNGANTSFGLSTSDGTTIWALGFEGGYFIKDDLALKAGLGYTDLDGFSLFSYKIGAKYYVNSQIPFQVDITGASIQDSDINPLWLGLQGGYAIFLNQYVSIEPGARYNFSLNNDFSEDGIFEIRVGFVLHL
ncbi:hypothetical protein [Robiginitalea sp. IMCC43444]|uniref:hypothetical protein n=1 Tax=Robiginitalea sp. IMCC43444 TaxID=3459121 RepID=UPI00404196A0